MGVEREEVPNPETAGWLTIAKLSRGASGSWSATVDIDVECDVGDGRSVLVRKQFTVRATEQRGRKRKAAPGLVDGVRHSPDCNYLHAPPFSFKRRPCNCGASARSQP